VRTRWHDLWGSARGPAARLAPQVRVATGAALLAASLASPATTVPGCALVAAIAAAWLAACRPPRKAARTSAALGLAMLLPYFLLVPLILAGEPAGAAGWWRALAPPWSVLVHGMACVLVSTATVATLAPGDLRRALARLPVPGVAAAILAQIVRQAATLADETRRISTAIAVRGAASGGPAALRVLRSLPAVWLPRVIGRAGRVADAMEVRGYCDAAPADGDAAPERPADAAALALAAGALALAVALRVAGAA